MKNLLTLIISTFLFLTSYAQEPTKIHFDQWATGQIPKDSLEKVVWSQPIRADYDYSFSIDLDSRSIEYDCIGVKFSSHIQDIYITPDGSSISILDHKGNLFVNFRGKDYVYHIFPDRKHAVRFHIRPLVKNTRPTHNTE